MTNGLTITYAVCQGINISNSFMNYEIVCDALRKQPKIWLVTGAAGFIGSNLVEALLKLGQGVIGLDNFSSGFRHNLNAIKEEVSPKEYASFRFTEGDIRDFQTCQSALKCVDYVLHQAALGSVPRSVRDPVTTNDSNISGFLNMLTASRDAKVKRFVYASSSSIYGDHPALPKREDIIGKPLSPYAVTKYVNELYADVFAHTYGFKTIGLRYFNIFGKRQDPKGAYAAVIPTWTSAMIKGEEVFINGDGKTSRDFCYIQNAIQANILAAVTEKDEALNQVYNIAVGERTTLNDLFSVLRSALLPKFLHLSDYSPCYRDFRKGDVVHSLADIGKAQSLLGYEPTHRIQQGIEETMEWYATHIQ